MASGAAALTVLPVSAPGTALLYLSTADGTICSCQAAMGPVFPYGSEARFRRAMSGDVNSPRRSIARQPQACADTPITTLAYPKCGPMFASRRLLPDYNPKAGYLPIRQKCSVHKIRFHKDL
jgi:hypothetical protein